MTNKNDTGEDIVKWAVSKSWLHRERRSKESVKVVRCRTMEELEKELKSWDYDK